jgi:ectoine hydroxylase-related dioxygenase (phytanoyl-CoA dioxygenase family)
VTSITDSDLAQLHEDGVVCLRQVLSHDWIDRIAVGVEQTDAEGSDASLILSMKDRGFLQDFFMWTWNEEFRAIVFDSPMQDLAREVLGSGPVAHWYDQLFVKEPGADVSTPWHHDLTFWPIAGEKIVSFWIPVDPVTTESSGLRYVRGSHRWSNRYKAVTPDYNSHMIDPALEDMPDIDADPDAFDLLEWEMEPGDVLAFHPLVVHGSQGNGSSSVRRRALASRWVGDDVVFAPKRHTMPLPQGHGLEPGDRLSGPLFPVFLSS